MFGARFIIPFMPLIKNFLLMNIIAAASIGCKMKARLLFASNIAGKGRPSIKCPMVKYIKARRITTEERRRRASKDVSDFSLDSPSLFFTIGFSF